MFQILLSIEDLTLKLTVVSCSLQDFKASNQFVTTIEEFCHGSLWTGGRGCFGSRLTFLLVGRQTWPQEPPWLPLCRFSASGTGPSSC